MSTKHTPGPWSTSGLEYPSTANGITVYCSDGVNVGTVGTSPYSGKGASAAQYAETAKANARLIAAAPELLAFAQMVAGGGYDMADIMTEARALIAKSTGK